MSTAATLIKKALFLNGASSPINPASPELIQLTFEALIDMLVDWDALNINLGVTIPTNQTDEINNPPDTNQVIQYNLSVISAPLFRLEAPMNVQARALSLYDDMQITYSVNPVSYLPTTLPIGTGNQQNVNGARYYWNQPDELTDNNGIPLLGGSGS
jgi:hypothetical protein